MRKAGHLVRETHVLTARDRKAISKAIEKKLLPGVALDGVIDAIQAVIQEYWADAECEQSRQKRSQIAKELAEVARCARQYPEETDGLLLALQRLGPDAHEKLEQNLGRLHVSGETYLSPTDIEDAIHLIRFRDPIETARVRRLADAAKQFEPKGRPPQDALGLLLNRLALLFEQATGKWPGRTWNPHFGYRSGREEHPYFEACLRAAGFPREEARKKLNMIRPILEARRATRKRPKPRPAIRRNPA